MHRVEAVAEFSLTDPVAASKSDCPAFRFWLAKKQS